MFLGLTLKLFRKVMVSDAKEAKINIAVKCFSTYSRNADLLKKS